MVPARTSGRGAVRARSDGGRPLPLGWRIRSTVAARRRGTAHRLDPARAAGIDCLVTLGRPRGARLRATPARQGPSWRMARIVAPADQRRPPRDLTPVEFHPALMRMQRRWIFVQERCPAGFNRMTLPEV